VQGARTAGNSQLQLEQQRDVQAEKQRLLDRAEEIVTLIAETPVTYIAERKAMLIEREHMALPSTDPERVIALVALYFPDANDAARSFEGECANYSEMLAQIAIQIAKREPVTKDDRQSFQNMLSAGDAVVAKVLGDVGVTYVRRRPVVYAPDLR
jgi:hypothetical protein